MQITHNQHTVPKVYLKTFGKNLYVYNKENGITFKRDIKKLSVKTDYYEHPSKNINDTEILLSKYENEWGLNGPEIIRKLKNRCKISIEDKNILSNLIAHLLFRTPSVYTDVVHVSNLLEDFFENNPVTEKLKKDIKNVDNKKIFISNIENILADPKKLIEEFYFIYWINNNSMHKFFTSDVPIISYNDSFPLMGHQKFLCLTPDICIQLIYKNSFPEEYSKIDGTIKHIKYSTIVYINHLTIKNSFYEIYFSNKRQKKFIEKVKSIYPNDLKINDKRTELHNAGKIYK